MAVLINNMPFMRVTVIPAGQMGENLFSQIVPLLL